MYLQVSADGQVSLQAREDFRAFEVRAAADGAALRDALLGVAGLDEEGFAWVLESWLLRQMSQRPPSPHWRADFDAMLAHARRQGWLRETPVRCVRAHVSRG